MADASDKPLAQINTQTDQQQQAQQQQQGQNQQAQQQQQGQNQQDQQQQQQQQPQQQQDQQQGQNQPQQHQPLGVPPNQYQQAYHGGSGPPSPHAPPQGSPHSGYAQMAPSSPSGGFYLPPQGYPSQGYPSPQQGYQYPPQLSQQYLPPQAYAQPQQYGYPPASPGYPPTSPGYPPQGAPPSPGYSQHGYPLQQGHPQHGYAPSPQYPPQQSYPQTDAWGHTGPVILKPTSDGYIPGVFPQNYEPQPDAEVIRKALSSGISGDAMPLIHVVPFLTPGQLESIRYFLRPVSLSDLIDKKMSSNFRDAVRAVVLGPLEFDVWLLNRAMEGAGTKEVFLDMVLLGRKNGDIDAIKLGYERRYKKYAITSVASELSGEARALFMNALEARRADENDRIDPNAIKQDTVALYTAMVGQLNPLAFAEILVTRSDAAIREIVSLFDSMYGSTMKGKDKGRALEAMIEKKFGGHFEDALLYIVRGATNKAARDAMLLEKTMKGLGTKDEELSYRLAVLHWDKKHFEDVKKAYIELFPKKGGLLARVKDETRGDYQKFLLALIGH